MPAGAGRAQWAPGRRWRTLALIAVAMVLATLGLAAAEHWLYPAKHQDVHAAVLELDRSLAGRLAPVEDVTGSACGGGRCRQAVSAGTGSLFARFATRELAAEAAAREAAVPGRDAYRSGWVVVSYPADTPAADLRRYRQVFAESEKLSEPA